jgi:hypothetical protein
MSTNLDCLKDKEESFKDWLIKKGALEVFPSTISLKEIEECFYVAGGGCDPNVRLWEISAYAAYRQTWGILSVLTREAVSYGVVGGWCNDPVMALKLLLAFQHVWDPLLPLHEGTVEELEKCFEGMDYLGELKKYWVGMN